MDVRMAEVPREAFFEVLFSDDLWKQFKRWMFPGKKSSNIYNYRDGNAAAKYGYINLMEFNKELIFTHESLRIAVVNQHLPVVKFLYKNYPIMFEFKEGCVPKILTLACHTGDLDIVTFIYNNLRKNSNSPNRKKMTTTTKYHYSNRPCTRFIRCSTRLNYCTVDALECAIDSGQLDIIKFFFNTGVIGYSKEQLELLISSGYLEIIKYIHSMVKINFKQNDMDLALTTGKLELVQYIFDQGVKQCSLNVLEQVICLGYLGIVKFVSDNKMVKFPADLIDTATINGRFYIVKWLHENKKQKCDIQALSAACRYNYLEIVKFLIINRKEFDINSCIQDLISVAINYDREDIINFLYQHRMKDMVSYGINVEKYNLSLSNY